jgi:hypothetical protein
MVSESTEFLIGSTMAQFEGLQEAEETQIVPGALGDLRDGQDRKLSAPYYGRGGMGLAMAVGTGLGTGTASQRITSDRAIPIGAVADFSDGVRLSLTKDEVRDLPLAGPAPGDD